MTTAGPPASGINQQYGAPRSRANEPATATPRALPERAAAQGHAAARPQFDRCHDGSLRPSRRCERQLTPTRVSVGRIHETAAARCFGTHVGVSRPARHQAWGADAVCDAHRDRPPSVARWRRGIWALQRVSGYPFLGRRRATSTGEHCRRTFEDTRLRVLVPTNGISGRGSIGDRPDNTGQRAPALGDRNSSRNPSEGLTPEPTSVR